MKKRINLITVVMLMVLTGTVTSIISYKLAQDNLQQQLDIFKERERELSSFIEALDQIDRRFIGDVERDTLIQGAVEGMIRATGDRWSHYFDPDSFKAYLQAQSNQSIGIGVTVEPDQSGIRIIDVVSKSPAEEYGLLAGDIITHINGAALSGMAYDDAIAAMRGEEFTVVSLTVARPSEGGGSFTCDVMRRAIIRDPVVSGILDTAQGRIGYVRIANFDDHADTEFIAKVDELIAEGVTGLIFDVRNNPGGKLSVLVRMLDYLLPEGDLITLRYKDGSNDTRSSGPECIEMPIAVLINGDSYSAAEFFAACLREYEWAVLVGERTSGKGYAQESFRLSDGSGFNLSTSEYVTAKGVSLADAGLTPDAEIILSGDEFQYTGSMDPSLDRQLARALQELR